MFGDLTRIAEALEALVSLKEAELAAKGFIFLKGTDKGLGEGEIMLSDPVKMAEDEAKREKYAQQVGIEIPVEGEAPGPLAPGGAEWPPEAAPPFEDLFGGEGTQRGSSEGLISPGPEGAESDEEAAAGRGGEKGEATGHIPR